MKKRLFKILISAVLYLMAIFIKFPHQGINCGIYVLSYIIVGFEILKKAFRNIKRGKVFDENFLMSAATLGAFAIGEFPEAVAVMLFYQVGELFQSYAVDKSRKSIADLMDLRPDYANVLRNGKQEKIDPDDVQIGEIILVKPGEKIPLDGKVTEGTSMIDTKALTGEPVPRKVVSGDEVLSGCINLDGILKIQVAKAFDESTATKILELVESASSRKAKSENFITKFARYYTPVVVIMALFLAFLSPIILKNANFSDWIYRALEFLVVSCPCALVISIPLSFFGGIGGASRKGILIKGSNYLEALANLKTVVFDKTGTLTKGVFDVQKIKAINLNEQELLKVVAHAQVYSNHPIAKSIKEAYGKEIETSIVLDYKEFAGRGIKANIDGKDVFAGNEKLMIENNIQYQKCSDVGTVIYVGINNSFSGYIVISDVVKQDAKKCVEDLKVSGVKKTIMLTGDRKEVAEYVGKNIGLDEVYAELLPDEKVKKVEELLNNKNKDDKLAYVGDGMNDAPVLALADVGIAMGGLGSDSAIEAADIVIMTDEPSKINSAIKIARKTMRIVRENIVFAIFVKVLVLVLSAMGLATMWEAVFADVGVSIIAIINAFRVLKKC